MEQSEYLKWLQWVTEHPEVEDRFPAGGCEGCTEDCGGCIMGLCSFDSREEELEESEEAFIKAVTYIVENYVEEFYLHPNWSPEEVEEYGIEWAYLVNLYCRLQDKGLTKEDFGTLYQYIKLVDLQAKEFGEDGDDDETTKLLQKIITTGGFTEDEIKVLESNL